jgi:hypothetical protein
MDNEDDAQQTTALVRHLIARRTLLKGIGAGAGVALWPSALVAGGPRVFKKRGSHFVDVVRPEDFLRLKLSFENLALDAKGRPVLRRINRLRDAVIVVDFGPQHIAEQALWAEGTNIKEEIPGVAQARLAGSSRLAFLLPEGENEIDYDLDTLLDRMTRYELNVVPLAPPASPTAAFAAEAAAVRRKRQFRDPAWNQTAIEVPWFLVLSPSKQARWSHATAGPVTHAGRTELWHTRLIADDGVRAVWARDRKFPHNKPITEADDPAPDPPLQDGMPFRMAYTPGNRVHVVKNSTAEPFQTELLMLTALGAYLDIDGQWPNASNGLVQWKERATLGRDHYVRIAERGYLYPFGHRALQVFETERRILSNPKGMAAAYLVKRVFFAIVQKTRTYDTSPWVPNDGRGFPFRAIEAITRVSPDVGGVRSVGNEKAIQPLVGVSIKDHPELDTPMQLAFRGIDRKGKAVTFHSPFVWVKDDEAGAPFNSTFMADLNKFYGNESDFPAVQRRTATVDGGVVAFADADANVAYPLRTFVLGGKVAQGASASDLKAGDQIAAFPVLMEAEIELPSIERLTGAKQDLATRARYHEGYVQSGFSGVRAFLELPDAPQLTFSQENAGGLVSPAAKLGLVTVGLGPTVDVLTNGFDPAVVFENLEAKILGGIDLVDVLAKATLKELEFNPELGMKFTQTQNDDEVVVAFDWNPKLKDAGAFKPMVGSTSANAVFHGEMRQSLANPTSRVTKFTGEITNFSLDLFGYLVLQVTKLGFRSQSGKKTDVDVVIDDLVFKGPLSFVDELRQSLKSLGNGFGIDVSPSSIEATMGFEVPTVAVGAFSLSNLAFRGALTLPLDGQPMLVRFGLSSREDPFALAISLFGGGGWLAITLGADRMELIDIGLEFGAMTSIDVGVANGGVEAVAGIYFTIEDQDGQRTITLAGYVRISGYVEVLAVVSMSLEVNLTLEYVNSGGRALVTGRAECTLKVEVLFFEETVSFEIERSFGGDANADAAGQGGAMARALGASAGPTQITSAFVDSMSPSDWQAYVRAFA